MPEDTDTYDVFINHCGPDVKDTVASIIYNWLNSNNEGLRVFLDKQEFQPGQELRPTIEKAIQTSSAHIAIFSKRYAESPWCLDELCLMLKTEAPIISVYYDVKPSDLRRIEKGAYAAAFDKHVQNDRFELHKIEDWKVALGEISNRYGFELNGPNFEGDLGLLCKTTVYAVLEAVQKKRRKIAKPLEIVGHPVGLDEAVENFKEFRSKHWQNERVNIFGIVGMAGLGKTTLAKAFYNSEDSSFKRASFLLDVNSDRKPLEAFQSQLLKDLLGGKPSDFDNTSQGLSTLKSRLNSHKSEKFFIVLDGIDGKDQLDALFVKDALGAGSLVIVTSRDKGLLERSKILLHHKMKPLDRKHAKELFCRSAFGKPDPSPVFEDLVKESLRMCDGLPCWLKDIGEFLAREHIVDEWEEGLDRARMVRNLTRELDKVFQEKSSKMKDAYGDLEGEQRRILLDIACFFVGEDKQLATRIWDPESAWQPKRCLKILEAKCLVGSDRGLLKMHYPFQVLGKYIAKQESPYRICDLDEGMEVVKQLKKGMEIRGIVAATGRQHDSDSFFRALLEKMQQLGDHSENSSQTSSISVGLKLLVINGDCFKSEFGRLSTDLAWLRWKDYPHTSIPSWLPMANLRVLEIEGHRIQYLWQKLQDNAPSQLRELKVTCRHRLEEILQSIGSLKNLEKIVLDCGNCICTHYSLPQPLCSIRSLQHLELHCQGLTSLPNGFENLTKLEDIDCSRCSELQRIPSSFPDLPNLKHLNLEHCNKLSIQPDILRSLRARENLTFIPVHGDQVGARENLTFVPAHGNQVESECWNNSIPNCI